MVHHDGKSFLYITIKLQQHKVSHVLEPIMNEVMFMAHCPDMLYDCMSQVVMTYEW